MTTEDRIGDAERMLHSAIRICAAAGGSPDALSETSVHGPLFAPRCATDLRSRVLWPPVAELFRQMARTARGYIVLQSWQGAMACVGRDEGQHGRMRLLSSAATTSSDDATVKRRCQPTVISSHVLRGAVATFRAVQRFVGDRPRTIPPRTRRRRPVRRVVERLSRPSRRAGRAGRR